MKKTRENLRRKFLISKTKVLKNYIVNSLLIMNEVSDLLVWGNNQSNLLSQATTKCIPNPIPLCLPFEISFICASEKHISFVTRDGKVYSYGINLDGRLGISTRNVDRVSFHEPIRVPIPGRVIKI